MSVIAAARPIAMFLRSFDVRFFWFVWLTVVSGTAATMLVPTSFLHLEGYGAHPIGWSVLCEADKRNWFEGKTPLCRLFCRFYYLKQALQHSSRTAQLNSCCATFLTLGFAPSADRCEVILSTSFVRDYRNSNQCRQRQCESSQFKVDWQDRSDCITRNPMISLIQQYSNRFTDRFPIVVYKWKGAIIHCFTPEVGGVWRH